MKNTLFLLLLIVVFSCKKKENQTQLQGAVFGTSYHITYAAPKNYQKQIDSLFYVINKSMSNYQLNSDISKINRGETILVDSHFLKVFQTAKQVYKETKGAFDPTIGTIVNAFGFGSGEALKKVDSLKIDSLMHAVGFHKVQLKRNRIIKPKSAFLDFNAIAKGYAVDLVSWFLEEKNIKNYLVEIGGEIRVKGHNKTKNKSWQIGIDEPNFDGTQSVAKIIALQNQAMATSGTYRKFKVDSLGNRYAHIINTKTGYPSKSEILSVSVIAQNCMMADAYATALQAMGLQAAKQFLQNHTELQAYFIYQNQNGVMQSEAINGFAE